MRGYTVEIFPDGKGIFTGNVQLPDLFILGRNLPTIDGIAICKYLKIQPLTKHLPVIMISAHPYKKRQSSPE